MSCWRRFLPMRGGGGYIGSHEVGEPMQAGTHPMGQPMHQGTHPIGQPMHPGTHPMGSNPIHSHSAGYVNPPITDPMYAPNPVDGIIQAEIVADAVDTVFNLIDDAVIADQMNDAQAMMDNNLGGMDPGGFDPGGIDPGGFDGGGFDSTDF